MISRSRFRGLVAVVGALAAIATSGCSVAAPDRAGSDRPSAKTASTRPAREPSSTLAGLTPRAVLERSRAAVADATSMHVTGRISEDGGRLDVDLHLARGRRATGTISGVMNFRRTTRTVNLELRQVGAVTYLRADGQFWAEYSDEASANVLSNRWVKVHSLHLALRDLEGLIAFERLTDSTLRAEGGALFKITQRPVGGLPTVGVRRDDPQRGSTVYIADAEKPYPLLRLGAGVSSTGLRFSDWNAPVMVTPPPQGLVIDLTDSTLPAPGPAA